MGKVMIAALMLLAGVAYGEAETIELKKAVGSPVIDGTLDDPCWQGQGALTNFTLNDFESTLAKKQTEAYICYDNENIYVGIKCKDPNAAQISVGITERDNKFLWTSECIELFLSPRTGVYYQFLLTIDNSLLDIKWDYETGEDGYVVGGFGEFKSDYSWNCQGYKSAIYKGSDYWSTEIAIPFSEIGGVPAAGDTWSFNVAREQRSLKELSTFSPLFGQFHQPEAYSQMSFQKDGAVIRRALKEIEGVDYTPGAKDAHKADKGPDPVVFVNNYLKRGYPTTLPKRGQVTDSLELFASLGEYEPVTFSVRAGTEPAKGVQASIAGDLKGKNGSVIPKENVDIRVVERWKRWITTRKRMWMERYLQKRDTVDIPKHTTQRFWLTVHVPEDAAEGIYRSKVLITAGEETLKTLDLEVEVLPFKLMSGEGMGYFMYLPEWGFPRELRTAEYLNKVFVDMREHGMTTASLYMSPVVVDGKVDVDKHLPWNFPVAGMMDVLRDTKLLGPGVPAIWLGPDTCSPAAWKDVLDESRKRNWPELVLYLQDEPGDEERNENARRLFRQVDEFKETYPEYKNVRTTTSLGGKGIEALGHLYDIWITGAGGDQEYLIKQARKANEMGKLLWSYDCALSPEDAGSARYYFGMWCWKTGMKGAALWAYSSTQNTTETRWDYIEKNLENTELQCSFVWPSADGPIPSVGWEAVREGVDDHKYLSTLSKMIEKAKAAGHEVAAQRAAGILKQVTNKVRAEGYREGMQGGRATGWRHGGIYHRTSPQPELTYGDYNKFRYRMAQEIIKLRKELEE